MWVGVKKTFAFLIIYLYVTFWLFLIMARYYFLFIRFLYYYMYIIKATVLLNCSYLGSGPNCSSCMPPVSIAQWPCCTPNICLSFSHLQYQQALTNAFSYWTFIFFFKKYSLVFSQKSVNIVHLKVPTRDT